MTEARPNRAADGTAWVEAGAGEPLVLVHGVGMNRAVWAPQMEAFADEYRVIAYDMLGHGDSPRPPEHTRLEDLSRQLRALLDELGIERAHLVGHSMGALVAVDFALRAPERVHDLMALNPVYERTPEQRAAVLERARRLADGAPDDSVEPTLDRWFRPDQRTAQADRIDRVRRWLETVDKPGYARVYGCFARADDAFVGRLSELAVPALFVTGEYDPNSTPDMSRRMADESPNGALEVVAGERHMMAFVEPDSVNPLIRGFMQRGNRSPGPEARTP